MDFSFHNSCGFERKEGLVTEKRAPSLSVEEASCRDALNFSLDNVF